MHLGRYAEAEAGYREEGRGAEAIAAMERAVALDENFARAYNSLGGMLIENDERAKAETALRDALRQQPDLAEADSNLGQLERISTLHSGSTGRLATVLARAGGVSSAGGNPLETG